jgi:hypothetical protein
MLLSATSEIALVRAWCFDLGLDRAAAALRRLAPHVRPPRSRPPRAAGSLADLLATLRALEERYAGQEEEFVLARTRELIEDDLWL